MVVGVLQSPGSVGGNPECHIYGQQGLAPQPVTEALPIYEGHREPHLLGSSSGVVHGKDIRVLEAGDSLDLALEAFEAKRLGQLGMQHLERH
jgi:hypothetical protein